MRHRAEGVPREAAPDPVLTRLRAAHLYVITPDASRERVIEVATAAARGGADVVQLRHKSMPRGELLAVAHELRRLIHAALLVVNDHVDIALLSGADGVHLGYEDLAIASARRVAGDRLIVGASASTVAAARKAVDDGADYIGCGPAFATPIKAQKEVIGPAGIAAVADALGPVPVFAIGGIAETNLNQLTDVGITRACVIRAVGDAADPEGATRRLRAMLAAV